MKSELIRKIIFFPVMIVYLWIPYSLIKENQTTLEGGEVFRFKPRPIDPYDAFRGKYVTLYFIQNQMKYYAKNFRLKSGGTAYVQMERDAEGYGVFGEVYKERPLHTDNYVEMDINYAYEPQEDDSATIYVQIPFSRYYLPEEMAPEAERLYNKSLRRNRGETRDSVYVDVRVKKGKAIIEELYIQGVPIKEFVRLHENDPEEEQ